MKASGVLIEAGMAVRYDGGKKTHKWCEWWKRWNDWFQYFGYWALRLYLFMRVAINNVWWRVGVMSNQDPSEKSKPAGQDTSQLTTDDSVAPIYFAVSPLKLVLMSFCTITIYQYYWFYKNWVLIKEREKSEISPFWRGWIFPIFFCFFFFKRVRVSAEAIPVNRSISPGLLAAGWIILPFLSILPDPYWLVSFLSYIILLPVQMAVNNINESVAPGHHKNENFTGWNIFGLVLVGLVLAIISFFPPEWEYRLTGYLLLALLWEEKNWWI